jgi:hypothetical protein
VIRSIQILILFLSHGVNAQDSIPVKVMYDKIELQPSKLIAFQNDSIRIDVVKFYLTNVVFERSDLSSELLYDLEKNHNYLSMPESQIKEMKFTLGVDSLTNANGISGGILDPIHGMYWSWQSGYINFKLEGIHFVNGIAEEFSYHIGGFLNGYNCERRIQLAGSSKGSRLELDLKQLLETLATDQPKKIMSPGKRAMELADILAGSFYLR